MRMILNRITRSAIPFAAAAVASDKLGTLAIMYVTTIIFAYRIASENVNELECKYGYDRKEASF
jgi:hypothetical protein